MNKMITFLLILLFVIPQVQILLSEEVQKQQEIEKLIDKGIEYERANNLDKAIEIYQKVLELDPENLHIKVRLAKVLSWKNEFDKALEILNEVIEVSPYHSEALFRKAQILSWKGEYKKAIATYELYLMKEKNDADALMGIGRACFWSGQYDKAIEYLKRALAAGADEVEVRMELGKVYLATDNKKAARDEFKKILEIDPENKDAKRFLRGIELLKTVEIEPMGIIWELYPDGSTATTLQNNFLYHYRQTFDFILSLNAKALNGTNDTNFRIGTVYMGINNLYTGLTFSFTPDADLYSPAQITASIDYGVGAGFVPGIEVSADIYSSETLFTISPRFTKYFTDYTYAVVGYHQYIYSTGYDTLNISFNLSMEYLPQNTISFGVSYGGDVETKDPEKRVFDFNTGITFRITENLMGIIEYSWVETKYGRTHRIGYINRVQW